MIISNIILGREKPSELCDNNECVNLTCDGQTPNSLVYTHNFCNKKNRSANSSHVNTMNTLEKIQKNLENFSKSERKVAEVIMASPQTAIHSSIATLAKMADVSEPTVNRFCRRLDTKGFPDFKLHLAQSLANGTPYVNRNVEESDGPDAYTHKHIRINNGVPRCCKK